MQCVCVCLCAFVTRLHNFCVCYQYAEIYIIDDVAVFVAVLVGASIGLFMAFQMKENGVKLGDPRAAGSTPRFYWGCLVAAGGVLCAVLSSIFFICEGCRTDSTRSYDGYDTTRTI